MTTATLGFQIDSSQATKATAELDKLTTASKKAETAAAGLSQQSGAVAAMAKRAGVSYEEMQQRIAKAAQPLRDAQASAAKGAMTLTETLVGKGNDGLTPAVEKAERSSRSLADTLTRRFVVGYAVSQIRSLGASLVSLAADTARIGDIGKLTGFGSADVQGITSAAGFKGIASNSFSGALASFNQQIPLAKAGVGELGALLRANKITIDDTRDAFFKVADLVKNATNDTARMSILQQAGLPATMEMVRFMGQGADAIRRQADSIAKLTDEQITAARKIDDKFNEISTNFETGFKKAVVGITGALGDLVSWWQGKVGQMVSPIELLKLNMNGGGGTRMSEADADAFYSATGAGRPATGSSSGGSNKPTRDYATEKAIAQDRISKQQQLLGIYGQTTTALEARRAVELQIQQLGLNGIGIDKERAETLKRLAEENNLGITQIKANADAYRVEAETIGMSTGKAAEFTAVQNALNEAKRNGKQLTDENVEAIKREAAALGEAAQKSANVKDAYEVSKGFFQDFRSNISNGADAWTSFGNAAVNALNRIASKLMDKAFDALWSSGGSGFFSSIGKLFGFAEGGVMTSAGPVPLRKYASGGIANSPQMAMYGEGSLPEAYVPLPDGRRIPVAMNMPQSQSWGGGNSGGALAIEVTSRIDKDGNIKAYVEKVSGTVAGQVVQYSSPGIVQQSVGAVAAMNRNSPGYVRKV